MFKALRNPVLTLGVVLACGALAIIMTPTSARSTDQCCGPRGVECPGPVGSCQSPLVPSNLCYFKNSNCVPQICGCVFSGCVDPEFCG